MRFSRSSSPDRSPRILPCLLCLFAFFLCVAQRSSADTIVLKNGRRIIALQAVEVGDKVHYQTSAGELIIPKSIVDHIEKGGVVPSESSPSQPAQAPVDLSLNHPVTKTTAADSVVEDHAVHDGKIDRGYIEDLESAARSGFPDANHKAAVAYNSASEFEAMHGDMDSAINDSQIALRYAPDDAEFLTDAAYLYLREGGYKQALEYLNRAESIAPDDPNISKLAGWAYEGLNKFDQAIAEWKHSLELRKDPEIQSALAKLQRDQQEEEKYRENESAHFILHYSGTAEPALAREVLHILEVHFAAIESELNFSPQGQISVVLYTQQAFEDITRAPSWAGALNDGRIRVPVQGLTEVTPELSRVLKHELTHSFIREKTQGRAPVWIQEGLAQWMEGKRSDTNAATLVQIYDQKKQVSLGRLEGGWVGFPTEVAEYAYAWALANVECIIRQHGMGDMERILDRIASGMSTEDALRDTLHSDYNDLMQSTADYLRKTYLP